MGWAKSQELTPCHSAIIYGLRQLLVQLLAKGGTRIPLDASIRSVVKKFLQLALVKSFVRKAAFLKTPSTNSDHEVFFEAIRSAHGGRCVAILQCVIKEVKQLLQLEASVTFLRSCATENLLPRSLWLNLRGRHNQNGRLKRQIGRKLLWMEISSNETLVLSLRRTLEVRRQCVFTIVGDSALLEHPRLLGRCDQWLCNANQRQFQPKTRPTPFSASCLPTSRNRRGAREGGAQPEFTLSSPCCPRA